MAESSAKNRSRYGYLNLTDIQDRIDSGKLDAYDLIYTKDTHECYILTEDLEQVPIKSRVYQFPTEEEALLYLNAATDTYEGQLVAIKKKNRYKAYIVNKDDEDLWCVTLLSDVDEQIDYNTLGNRPIVNLEGSLAEPIMVGNLDNGIYSVKGQYRIFESVETVFQSSENHIFLVDKTDAETHIKDISAHRITDYSLVGEEIKKEEMVTSAYLAENNYVTDDALDKKLQALDYISQTEAKEYIESVVTNYLDAKLDESIDKKLDEKIAIAEDSAIDEMFDSNTNIPN
ncbi:hypothetical protein [Clostridium sp. AF32-12BH]|uniref:hypothetical protein n=1 Tax=Clostridium sp. AF32-12BH TaxID=2292006 RepID=UPI000E4A58BF|nr:hypothetical protein [Clostridium sp. AF32-12BH]RHP45341.1 hypothetical protein DWZ40_13090 [Clostridium sp. AF32-12BH]